MLKTEKISFAKETNASPKCLCSRKARVALKETLKDGYLYKMT